ncbi:MAG: aspartate/glutamate racemase family protein [Actinomycetes bacterium]
MRIWHQSVADLSGQPEYHAKLEEHVRAVASETVTVDLHGLPPGSYGSYTTTDVLGSPFLYHMLYRQVIDYARQAESEGYDAFVVGSYSEPFVREMRAVVDIPVVTIGESCMLVACSLGKKQALISSVPAVARIVDDHVDAYGLRSRVSTVCSVGPMMDELKFNAGWTNPQDILDRFTDLAIGAVQDGADVIVPAEAVLSELLRTNDITSIGGAPVLDTVGVTWRYAEMMVSLWEKTGLRVGRAWEYARPDADLIGHFVGHSTAGATSPS